MMMYYEAKFRQVPNFVDFSRSITFSNWLINCVCLRSIVSITVWNLYISISTSDINVTLSYYLMFVSNRINIVLILSFAVCFFFALSELFLTLVMI